MGEHVAANIRNHALAEPIHRVEARGACQREDQANAGQRGEIFVDQVGFDPREAEIDHAPDGKRDGKGGSGRNQQGSKGHGQHPLMAKEIRPERLERAKRGAFRRFPVATWLRGLPGGSATFGLSVQHKIRPSCSQRPDFKGGGRLREGSRLAFWSQPCGA